MDAEAGQAKARAMVAEEMARRGWNVADLARAARIDLGTAGDFLNGTRWLRRATQNKIEEAVEWWPGTIGYYERGEEPPPRSDSETVSADDDHAGVLLDIDRGDFESLDPMTRKRAMAEMTALFYKIAEDARRRADSE